MKKKIIYKILLTVLIFANSGEKLPAQTIERVEEFQLKATTIKHVVIVVFENTDYPNALKQSFFAKLAKEGTLFTNYYGVTHPSQPNYIALIGGSTFTVNSDSNFTIDARHLGNLLQEKGKSWRVYAEGWPGNCFLGARKGQYVRKHIPFISFKNTQNSKKMCDRILNSDDFVKDITDQNLPEFSLYVPDLRNDGHDTSVVYANNWYKNKFGPLLQRTNFTKDLLLITTFDEGSETGTNKIYTSFWGPSVKKGARVATTYDHYSLLRTIENIFKLGSLGREDSKASVITGW